MFAPNDNVTREEASAIIYGIVKFKDISLSITNSASQFSDNDEISEYAKTGIEYLSQCGVISGMEDGSFAPKRFITREEAAKLVFSLLKTAA